MAYGLSGLVVLIVSLLVSPVTAAPRGRALVIGNAAYDEAPLRNPVNDAEAMAATLGELGFTVALKKNITQREMEQAITAFANPGQSGGIGLFYFSGHGMQAQGQNYMLPLKAQIDSEADVRYRAVPAEWVLVRMEEAGYRLNLVILDACRNNPYARRWKSATKGLAVMEAPVGSLVAYATAPGKVADDGAGRNGVYTSHLLQQMRVPGLTLEELFRRVRVAVMAETRRLQVPWESSSLTEPFVFVPATGGTTASPVAPAAAPAKTFVNSLGMQFVLIPAGEFQMGSHDGYDNEKPVHSVRISTPFYLGAYEVTQGQWQAIMGNNPSHFKWDANLPVEQVSWEDVQTFIRHMNAKEGGTKYRLPTEAEWEYAARAGTAMAYSFGNDERQAQEYAWCHRPGSDKSSHAGDKTHPVGQLKPNAWGLYDMYGNVWEWVQDWYGPYSATAAVDPAGPSSGSDRVVRGGGWRNSTRECRSAYRRSGTPSTGLNHMGFRLLRTIP